MGSAWAAADAISGAAVSVVPVVAREPETFAAVLAPAQRLGEVWCVAGHAKAAWRQRVVRYVGASAGMMLVIATSVMTRGAQRVLMRRPQGLLHLAIR